MTQEISIDLFVEKELKIPDNNSVARLQRLIIAEAIRRWEEYKYGKERE